MPVLVVPPMPSAIAWMQPYGTPAPCTSFSAGASRTRACHCGLCGTFLQVPILRCATQAPQGRDFESPGSTAGRLRPLLPASCRSPAARLRSCTSARAFPPSPVCLGSGRLPGGFSTLRLPLPMSRRDSNRTAHAISPRSSHEHGFCPGPPARAAGFPRVPLGASAMRKPGVPESSSHLFRMIETF